MTNLYKMASRRDSLEVANFKTVNELRSLREGKGYASKEFLKVSEANKLYYKATPIEELNLENVLAFMDEFAEQKEAENRSWVPTNLEKYEDCVYGKTKWDQLEEEEINRKKDEMKESKMRKTMEDCDLFPFYRRMDDEGSKRIFVEDIVMENLMRARTDESKEKLRLRKYKKRTKQFLKIYKMMKGSDLDYSDALKAVNAPSIRESCLLGSSIGTGPGRDTYWDLGRYSFPINMATFSVNRRRLLKEVSKKYNRAVIVLKGTQDLYRFDSNEKYPFRQEPFFLWTFGAVEPDFWGILDCWSGKTVLFHDAEINDDVYYAEMQEKYEVDRVCNLDKIEEIVSELNPEVLLILSGVNTYSGRSFPTVSLDFDMNVEVNESILYDIMTELRVFKTNFELDLMRYSNRISSLAHRLLMKRISADCYEYQAEALFEFFSRFVGGCDNMSYRPICSSGSHSADPRYTGRYNDRLIKCEDLVIFDMGASFYGYASSVASTIPSSGSFNLEQKLIYNVVSTTKQSALDVIKAGVHWFEIEQRATSVLLSGLSQCGLIRGDIDESLRAEVASIFMPFEFGHFLGLDRVDVGHSRNGSRTVINRVLKPGMVLVVQAGCYFDPKVISQATIDPRIKQHFDKERLCKFLNMGGIYLKDNVVVTYEGCDLMTDLPRTVDEVESWLAEKHKDDSNLQPGETTVKDELWLGLRRNPCTDHDEADM